MVELEVKARSHDSDQQTIAGLEEMVGDVKRERDALKDSNRDLSEKSANSYYTRGFVYIQYIHTA